MEDNLVGVICNKILFWLNLIDFLTSTSWMTTFPNTTVLPLAKPIFDHFACVMKMGTSIPKTRIFRLENYWLQHSDFKQVVANAWNIPVGNLDAARCLTAKFKNLSRALKQMG